jgi:hypothetical protein
MTVNTAIKSYLPQGADFYRTTPSATPPTGEGGPRFELGTEVTGENGTTWVFVKAATAHKQFDCVTIDESFNSTSITNTTAAKGYMVGFAQVAFTILDYGWVAIAGSGIQCRVKAVLNHSGKIYGPATSSGSAGVLRASAAGRTKIGGLVTVTTSSGSAKSPEIQANWPVLLI